MQYADLIRQILDINKKAFENSLNVMVAFQEQAEKMVAALWMTDSCFPQEGKKAARDWLSFCKNGLADYQDHVDKRFKLMEYYLMGAAGQMASAFDAGMQKKVAANQDDEAAKKPKGGVGGAAAKKTSAGKKIPAKKKTIKK